jgi:hypothetical protein
MDRIVDYSFMIVCDLCCTAGIYTVEHLEDGHTSDRNMYVLTMRGIYNSFKNVHFFWFTHK